MNIQQSLDSLPIGVFFLAFAIISLITYESGYRLGRWWQAHTPDEKEGPTAMIVGSLLGLLGFLLAITMGMASDRFDTRRGLVLAEANSVGTTYLRAGYLPEPASGRSQDLLREYVPLRIASSDLERVRTQLARSVEIHNQLWSIAEELARSAPESEVLALYIESLNETIDLHETRMTSGLYARVPATVVFLLLLGSTLTLGMIGYNAGLTGRRGPVTAVALVVVLGAVTTLIVDLDRPREGLLTVSQQPLIDLQEQITAGARSIVAQP
jgi:hypothetical protein